MLRIGAQRTPPYLNLVARDVHGAEAGAGTTGCGRPSNSDFDILRSSINRMGKMGGGVPQRYPPDRPVSVPARHSNELRLPDQILLLTSHNSQAHFTKRRGDFFSSRWCSPRHPPLSVPPHFNLILRVVQQAIVTGHIILYRLDRSCIDDTSKLGSG